MRFRTDAPVATNMLKLMFFHTEHILLTVNTLIVHTRLPDLAIREKIIMMRENLILGRLRVEDFRTETIEIDILA